MNWRENQRADSPVTSEKQTKTQKQEAVDVALKYQKRIPPNEDRRTEKISQNATSPDARYSQIFISQVVKI